MDFSTGMHCLITQPITPLPLYRLLLAYAKKKKKNTLSLTSTGMYPFTYLKKTNKQEETHFIRTLHKQDHSLARHFWINKSNFSSPHSAYCATEVLGSENTKRRR